MAAVAGGIAECVGQGLLDAGHKEIIVENGGDLFLSRSVALTVSIFAGQSPLSNRLGLNIVPEQMPLGICTSSGTVGHSLSFGLADSVTVVADSDVVDGWRDRRRDGGCVIDVASGETVCRGLSMPSRPVVAL